MTDRQKLRLLKPLVRSMDTRTTKLPAKRAALHYLSPEHRAWRTHVVGRAGGRCEARDDHGLRCSRAWPEHRMYADHIIELRDRGAPFDLNNGQCLCHTHHERKTFLARVARVKS